MDNERKSYQLAGKGTNLLTAAQGNGYWNGGAEEATSGSIRDIRNIKDGSYRFSVLFPAKFPTKAVGDALKAPRRHDRS
ncbi:Hypothetical protein Cul210931_1642 [Corynebacterium ulcerans]|nr:Hypothetical protein Cul210931_1642 [Corynebacterium ulcerans]